MTRCSTKPTMAFVLTCIVVLIGVSACNDNDAGGRYSAACGRHSWCNMLLPPGQRANLLIPKLTRKEKFQLMAGDKLPDNVALKLGGSGNRGIPRLGIPPMYIVNGPTGIRIGNLDGTKGRSATAMPAPIALAATWDPSMAHDYGAVLGEEGRAMGFNLVEGPDVNVMRVPLNGRNFEAYGEDPELTSSMGVGWIRGLQAQGIMSNVKHFVANSQEHHRFKVDETIDERTLRELYLPAFKAAVQKGHAASLMEAYNQVNGHHMTENRDLVQGILKNEWGFKGFTVTDYYVGQHSTVASANAGNDLEMPIPNYYTPEKLGQAVDDHKIAVDTINAHVHRILRTMFAFKLFDTQADTTPAQSSIPVAMEHKHAKTALAVAEASMTLLKNTRNTLPLHASGLGKVAVIGSLADRYQRGRGSSAVTPFYTVSPLEGIKNRLKNTGVQVTSYTGGDQQQAAQTASNADVAIVVVGDFEAEGGDRPCLGLDCIPNATLTLGTFAPLPDFPQNGLVERVSAAQPNTIVVVEAGAPVLMPWAQDVPAVLYAYYPGEEGGNAIASVLFGDVNPSGHLPFTIPKQASDMVIHGNPKQYPGVNDQVVYSEGIFTGYRHYDEDHIQPQFPFGYGLTYTQFKLSNLQFHLSPSGGKVTVSLTNVGQRTGAQVVQLYLGLPGTAEAPEPPKWLRHFSKVRLAPGQLKQITFNVTPRDLSYWNVDDHGWKVAPGCYKVMVGVSSRDIAVSGKTCLQ